MSATRTLRIVLALLLAVTAATQYLATRRAFRPTSAPPPFELGARGREIATVRGEARAAGLAAGDALVAIDGRAIGGLRDLAAAFAGRGAGARVAVEASSPSGEHKTAVIEIPPPAAGSGAPGLIVAIALSLLLPGLCIALGFWAAFVRPTDTLAWLLLGLLLGFTALVNVDTAAWPPIVGEVGAAWRALLRHTWPATMMWFGLRFPRPFESEPKWRWAAIAVTTLFGANALWRAAAEAVALRDLDAAARIVRPLGPTAAAVSFATFACVGLFFSSLGFKSGTLHDADDRRRLRLLWAGTTLAIGPLFLLIVATIARGDADFSRAPSWVLVPTLLLLPLFPVTLAYVIVVQRAMDVRVALRLGVQYALARRGGTVALGLVGAGLAYLLSRVFIREDVGVAGKAVLVVLYLGLLLLIGKTSRRFKRSVDRRFFRDSYDAELILTELADNVGTIVDRHEMLETVARKIDAALHVPRSVVLVPEGGALRTVHAVGFPEGFEAHLPADGAVARHLGTSAAPAAVWPDDPASWLRRERASAAEIETLRALDARLLVPARLHGRLVGVLSLGPKLSEEPYSIVDQRLLRTVVAQTALALEHARLTEAVVEEARRRERLQRDVEIAREVQESLFPKDFPAVPGVDLAGACRPAQGVGGDYFDFLSLPDRRLGLAIADVSGKGISAALLMSALQASLRGQALHPELDLAALMSHVNRLVHDASPSNRYATFFYAQYDPGTRRLEFVNAGHNPPIVLRPENGGHRVLRLERCGTVVGMFPDSAWTHATFVLEPGDLLVGFTDGVSEAMNRDDEEWGEPRLIATLRGCDGLSAVEIIPRVMAEADAFAAGAPQHDDMTLVVLRVAG